MLLKKKKKIKYVSLNLNKKINLSKMIGKVLSWIWLKPRCAEQFVLSASQLIYYGSLPSQQDTVLSKKLEAARKKVWGPISSGL